MSVTENCIVMPTNGATIQNIGSWSTSAPKKERKILLVFPFLKKFGCLKYLYRFAIHRNTMQQGAINQRELLKGTLGTIILQLLSDNKKLYGYEITQLVKVKSNSAVLIKEGSLYPALHKLEAEGFIKSEEVYIGKRVRKYYSLTPPGKKYTKAAIQELQSFIETMQSLLIPNPPNNVPA